MEKSYSAVVLALAFTLISADAGLTCQQEVIQNDIAVCMMKDPMLAIQFASHYQNLNTLLSTDFLCHNRKSMVSYVLCLEDKFASCFPDAKDTIQQYMPNQERWDTALEFFCSNLKEFQGSDCMDQSQLQDFMQCYINRFTNIMSLLTADHNIEKALCSNIHMEEQCFKTYHGKCSDSLVDVVIKTMDKLFPFCPAATFDTQGQAMGDALSQILQQGKPLRFSPSGDLKYSVQKN